MTEELGIAGDDIVSIKPWGLTLDLADRALDIVSVVTIKLGVEIRLSGEHRQVRRLTSSALKRALKREPSRFMPAVQAIIGQAGLELT